MPVAPIDSLNRSGSNGILPGMTAKEVLDRVKALPVEDWIKIQSEIASMLAQRLSDSERAEIAQALKEAEAELSRGEKFNSLGMRRHFGLR
jgi:hypothetical protein